MNDQCYRSHVRKILTEFTADVLMYRCSTCETQEMLESDGFNVFVDKWIMEHIPLEMGEEKSQGHC